MQFSFPEIVNVRNIKETHERLSEQLTKDKTIEIDLKDCKEIDISGLQLIESARVFAKTSGTPAILSSPANTVVAAALDRAGFTASMTGADRLFWFHKE